ncbi:GntR family transcriptional regulator [Halolamina sp. CBA1230]|uniref:helix-turn-helix transcriptional regulator n=1 Tax=Halolamina sp. CBA1230 TaxID=1853690 RepID=UPI0009A1D0DD|nr:MarR family transcriptional regulator [Halolamina sp. CBA1230]QKY20045.1 GntR family transcriptional regulator [Halolamina sp. CBA1230]
MATDGVDGQRVRDVLRKRGDVLAALSTDRLDKRDLGEAVGVSRSTVDRAIAELVETGLVREADGGFEATHAGQLALETHRAYRDATDTLGAAEPLLAAIPDDAPISTDVLDDGTVTYADPALPETALTEVLSRLPEAETLRGFAPVVKTNYVSMLEDAVVEEGLTVEIVVTAATLDSLENSAPARAEIAEFFAADAVDVFATEEELPYALWLLNGPDLEHAGITVHEGGAVVGVLSNDDPDVVATYREQYEAIRDRASRFDADTLDQ